MGINKPNCRWVVHFHSPLLLSEYVQEVGRGGRDGKPAIALTLVSEPTGWLDAEDKQRWQSFQNKEQKQRQKANEIARKLPPQGNVESVKQQFRQDGAIALALLHAAGELAWQTPFDFCLNSQKRHQENAGNLKAGRQMDQFLHSRQCRWQFLRTAFGCDTLATDWSCGHCDNCRR